MWIKFCKVDIYHTFFAQGQWAIFNSIQPQFQFQRESDCEVFMCISFHSIILKEEEITITHIFCSQTSFKRDWFMLSVAWNQQGYKYSFVLWHFPTGEKIKNVVPIKKMEL